MNKNKIKTLKEIVEITFELRKKNKKIVTTNGVFDILHIGHIRYLQEAKSHGDILIIAINSDESVKKLKGPNRPINNEILRAEMLAALEIVDYIFVFKEDDPREVLSEIKPDFHIKGGDYKIEDILEKDTVERNKGKIILIPEEKGYSTTSLIEKINNI